MSIFLLISSLHSLPYRVSSEIVMNIFIPVVPNKCFVFAVTGIISTIRIMMGIIEILYILILLCVLISPYITSLRYCICLHHLLMNFLFYVSIAGSIYTPRCLYTFSYFIIRFQLPAPTKMLFSCGLFC